MDDFEWLTKRIGYLLDNDSFDNINATGKKYIPTFRPGAWTILKELLLAYYAPNYLSIMRKKEWINELCYVDLFAGSGVLEIDGLKKYYLGSPLVILNSIKPRFDSYFFLEKDTAKLEQLKKLTGLPEESYIQGDCNESIDRILPRLSNRGSHSLIFIDPFSTEIGFNTIRNLGKIGCDMVLTFASEEIFRVVRQAIGNPSWEENALDRFFGDSIWREELKDAASDIEIFEYYKSKIVTEAYKKIPTSTLVQKTMGGHHYFILLTSTGGRGEVPGFFNIVKTFNKKIQSLDGERVLKFLKHYRDEESKGLGDF